MDDARPTLLDRLGPWFAGIWLFFLLDNLQEGWAHRDETSGIVGILATVAFAVTYLAPWVQSRHDRSLIVEDPPLRVAVGYLAALVGLGAVMVTALGEEGLAAVVYVAVTCVKLLPLRAATAAVVVLELGLLALGAAQGWDREVDLMFAVLAASAGILGLRTLVRRTTELVEVNEENASLAVENERTRFARDLHDILGHSLTVITVKAELAQRLLDVDVERARAELADLERLSRDALADVREAVSGYRQLTLPGELARARHALAAAEIEARVPGAADEVPTELRELFAWTVREGVTNVIRHSGAGRCEVRLTATRAEVRDDGPGLEPPTGTGSGLAGLRERAAAVGATVIVRRLEPGFSLEVSA